MSVIDLNAARIFVNVVRKGSFSAASKAMGIPVATVSRRVAELESSLESRLLERTTRKLRLTNTGATLFEFVSRGLEEMEAGVLALNDQESNLKGELRLSIPPSFDLMWGVIDEFQTLYPNIKVDLFCTDRHVDFIEDGVDLTLRIGEVNSQSSVARKISTYRHKLVASPLFLANKRLKKPQDLLNQPCAAWCKKDQLVSWTLGNEVIKISPILRDNDYIHMCHVVLNDRCITELPPFMCEKYIATGQLIEVLSEYPLPEQPIYLVYPSRKSVSRITRAFIDYCLENLKI